MPTRHSMTELHRSTDDATGAPITAGFVPIADGAEGVTWGAATGANAELNIEGGQDVIKAHGNMGATETFDPTDGNVHTGTLNATCTFTINAPSGSGYAELLFAITGDGSSAIVWPGTATLVGGPFAVIGAGLTQEYIVRSYDGGTGWIVSEAGGGGSSVAALDDLTDVQTSGETAGVGLFFDGSVWRPGYAPEPLLLEDGTVAILENGHAAMSEPTYI